MPFDRPTLTALRQSTRAEIQARLPGADTLLRQSNLRVLADVFAGSAHGTYGYLDWLARQVIPDTADAEHLERWADLFDVPRKAASLAAGEVTFTGVDGTAVPGGTELRRSDGLLYAVALGGNVAGGTLTLPVEALSPGAAGNADAATPLSLSTAIAGLDAAVAVAAGGLAGGADAEDDDSLRARLLFRLAEPPQGGNAQDYAGWALAVPGVTRVWVYPMELGEGTVTLRFMMDEVRAADDGIPQGDDSPAESGDQALVYAALEALRPVTDELFVVAPVPKVLDLTITGLSPDTPEVRAAVEAELADLIRRVGEPGKTLYRSKLWEAVSIAAGEDHHVLTLPAADVTHATGEIPVLGVITYA